MSDNEAESSKKLFAIDRAKQGRAGCKKCKQKCETGELRIAKVVPSPFGEGTMKSWHHLSCIFELFMKQRVTTKRIESPDDLEGFESLSTEDQALVTQQIEESEKAYAENHGIKYTPKKKSPKKVVSKVEEPSSSSSKSKDDLFREFRRLVAEITNVSSYLEKTSLVKATLTKGSNGKRFEGDVALWCRMLLPGVVKRVYNLQSKQLVKLFSKIFQTDQTDMLEHLEQGDIGGTIEEYFEQSNTFKPVKKSRLTLQEVDGFLEELSQLTKEDEQAYHFKKFAAKCTSGDLKVVIRLIKHDLRMNAGAKHILEGVHQDAYGAYQSSRDLNSIIARCLNNSNASASTSVKAMINIMTPVLPMLAEACKSVEQAMKKCPNGMYSEIKYDGERVQVHKQGSTFKYFSRSLKPVLPHKVAHFKDFIPKAFPHAEDLILDSEILMVDTTGKPLPFGTLGAHKKAQFKDASVCLFIFDCIFYNGEDLTREPIKHRKKILREKMIEIPNHIVFSEMEEINHPRDLASMIAKVLKQGLEGLVLKDKKSVYEPGKRHWLKVKKDYLFDGAMADSADLLVLGAWYGTGKKGGMMSVFLMGCYDAYKRKFVTVTKVHTGHDDKTLERLQTELKMVKISCDASKVPSWLKCSKSMVPDFVAADPKDQPVWEITGAEFTKHEVHTADGISIRFPRVTKIRDDKTWETATNLQELHVLFDESKNNIDLSLLTKDEQPETNHSPSTKRKSDTQLQTSSKKIIKKDESTSQDVEIEIKKEVERVELLNPLPDYFQGVRLMVDECAEDGCAKWVRYFVAYGGVVVDGREKQTATHVLHDETRVKVQMNGCSKNARHIHAEWIKESIARESLQDCGSFAVVLLPEES